MQAHCCEMNYTCTESPTPSPSSYPSAYPSMNPTPNPSFSPSIYPTSAPSIPPTETPTSMPSVSPTEAPTSSFAPTSNMYIYTETVKYHSTENTMIALIVLVSFFIGILIGSRKNNVNTFLKTKFKNVSVQEPSEESA